MESNNNHCDQEAGSRISSGEEEVDHRRDQDQENGADDERGTGRSYECVFCKRGFTTAQALGGHMNIHRKDRARNSGKPSSSSSSSSSSTNKQEEKKNHHAKIPRFDKPNKSYPHRDYSPHLPASSTSNSRPIMFTHHGKDLPHHGENPRFLNDNDHLGEENYYWRMKNLGFPLHGELLLVHSEGGDDDHEETKRQNNNGSEEDDQELDLELRLGHDP